ncbi:mediator complex subunit 27 [Brevipalpus obovatus]|uniref:mediator complex subunit 27 n=1 Tax=Brevipalpus obovatus TaxID=246614 RepID=UPI003D9F1B61
MSQYSDMDENLKAIGAAMKAVKLLRSTMNDLFKCLVDGPGYKSTSDSNESADKQFLSDVQQLINSVNTRIRELETSSNLMSHGMSTATNLSLGNTAHLGQDPAYDRTTLYSSLISSYRWNDKMQEYATNAHQLLSQNLLKRSQHAPNPMAPRPRGPGTPITHRPLIGHNIPDAQIDGFLQALQRPDYIQRTFADLQIEVMRPFGAPAILKVTCERVLRAIILLRGVVIEWVLIKGLSENFEDEDGKLDIWSESRYEVFRKITDHANSAMLYFVAPFHVDLGIRSFLSWLNSYKSLFSSPCRKCDNRLQNSMPPTWRDFRSLESYHDTCRP